jgi:predicted 2-oxoglutarate/Fe(II)-dependent dioxygenase YbiX
MADSSSFSPLAPGDVLPTLVLEQPGGRRICLGAESLLGCPVALWFQGAIAQPILAQALGQKIEAFREFGTQVYAVGDSDAGIPSNVEVLLDPGHGIGRSLGIESSGIAVFDRDFRLAAVRPLGAIGEALDIAAALYRRTAPSKVLAAAPALIIHDVFEPALCRALIDYWDRGEKRDSLVATAEGMEVKGDGRKRRVDVWVEDAGLNAAIASRFLARVYPAMFKAFQFRAAVHQKPRVGCYDSRNAGAFGRHRDDDTPYTRHRQFAVTLNLNTGEYEGGELWFPEYGRQLYVPGVGGAAVFSCSLLHEALPVISGRRFGVFTFVFDAEAANAATGVEPD